MVDDFFERCTPEVPFILRDDPEDVFAVEDVPDGGGDEHEELDEDDDDIEDEGGARDAGALAGATVTVLRVCRTPAPPPPPPCGCDFPIEQSRGEGTKQGTRAGFPTSHVSTAVAGRFDSRQEAPGVSKPNARCSEAVNLEPRDRYRGRKYTVTLCAGARVRGTRTRNKPGER